MNKSKKTVTPKMGNVVSLETTPFNCYVRCKEVFEYVIPVIGPIEYTHDFLEAVAMIEMAEQKDKVILKINSCGGSLSAVDYLLQALSMTEAHIHADVSGELMSAATLIMDYVDSFNISDNTCCLIHNAVFGEAGKHADVVSAVNFADKMNKSLLHRYYDYMFSEEEMTQLYEGRQFFMDNTEYLERYERRMKVKAEIMAKLQEEAQDEDTHCSCGSHCSCSEED